MIIPAAHFANVLYPLSNPELSWYCFSHLDTSNFEFSEDSRRIPYPENCHASSASLFFFSWICHIAAGEEIIGRVTVTAKEAKIKRGREVIATAQEGDVLNVIEIKGNWYGVIPAKGWIYKKYVEHNSLGEDDKVADKGETEEGDDA